MTDIPIDMSPLERMCRAHFNEPMLSFGELARCVGYGEDDQDSYILVKRKDGNIIWHTGVGGFTWLTMLKGQAVVYAYNGKIWNDFTRLDSELSLNGCEPEEEFILRIERKAGMSVVPDSSSEPRRLRNDND